MAAQYSASCTGVNRLSDWPMPAWTVSPYTQASTSYLSWVSGLAMLPVVSPISMPVGSPRPNWAAYLSSSSMPMLSATE